MKKRKMWVVGSCGDPKPLPIQKYAALRFAGLVLSHTDGRSAGRPLRLDARFKERLYRLTTFLGAALSRTPNRFGGSYDPA